MRLVVVLLAMTACTVEVVSTPPDPAPVPSTDLRVCACGHDALEADAGAD